MRYNFFLIMLLLVSTLHLVAQEIDNDLSSVEDALLESINSEELDEDEISPTDEAASVEKENESAEGKDSETSQEEKDQSDTNQEQSTEVKEDETLVEDTEAQEEDKLKKEKKRDPKKKKEKKPKQAKPEIGTFIVTSGLQTILVTETTKKSVTQGDNAVGAPMALLFSVGFGANIQITNFLVVAPQLTFYMNYYLWKDGRPQIAEIEMRTAQTFNFLLNFPVLYRFFINRSVLSVGGGVMIAARWGMTAQGVPDYEQEATDKINQYFWKGLNYLYPSAQISFDQILRNGFGVGVQINYYFQFGNVINKNINIFDGNMLSISFRLTPPYKIKIPSKKGK
ncbi:MAG: hypothetical protein ACRC4W_03070 [Treponemataceae bacterium]